MHFYGLTFDEVSDLPIYTFFELDRNISRIEANNDLRLVVAVNAGFAGNDKLIKELQRAGRVRDVEAQGTIEMDVAAVENLKAMMGSK